MAKFKCTLSGNVFEYFTDFDIETMRDHPQYEELEEEEEYAVQTKVKKTTKKEVTKKDTK
jgi:hypothetical protein